MRRVATGRLWSVVVFAVVAAAILTLLGDNDLENYVHSFVSLNRGTAMPVIQVLGLPVYTLAMGLGVRLPLHGSLGASPAAAIAPFVPEPVTYMLMLAVAIGASGLIVRHALEPVCGRIASWLALILLFWSAPIANYVITDDWPETALTYCAIVACVFAPHALLALKEDARVARWSMVAVVFALIGASHPGYWSIIGGTLVLTGLLALCRHEYPLQRRLRVLVALAAASALAVGLQLPDLLREIEVAGSAVAFMRRTSHGPVGALIPANLFPFGEVDARQPFTLLPMTLVALAVGAFARTPQLRRLVIGSTVASIACAIAAAHLPPLNAAYAPSSIWALRDPAFAFAVFGGAMAAAVLQEQPIHGLRRIAAVVLMGAALQSLLQATWVADMAAPRSLMFALFDDRVAPHGTTPPERRLAGRGLSLAGAPPGSRVGFWPGVLGSMRNVKDASSDVVDAGYSLVTSTTKQRTMIGLVEPNRVLFTQETELSSDVLCDPRAVAFLQLRYLLAPRTACDPWTQFPARRRVDGWLDPYVATVTDDSVHVVDVSALDRLSSRPALSAGSPLIPALTPLPGTAVTLQPRGVAIDIADPQQLAGRAVVLPVAYDSGWTSSSGSLRNSGGLLAMTGANQRHVSLAYVPDSVAVLRAVTMTSMQLLACLGLVGLASARPWTRDSFALDRFTAAARRSLAFAARRLAGSRALLPVRIAARHPRTWLYLAYSGGVITQLDWHPEGPDETSVLTAMAFPAIALAVTLLNRWIWPHRILGAIVMAGALLPVLAAGSQSAEAMSDPLFWGVLAIASLVISRVTGRWRAVALIAAAVAGACLVAARLVPWLGDPAIAYQQLTIRTARDAFATLRDALGSIGLGSLLAISAYALLGAGWAGRRRDRIVTAAQGALLTGWVIALAGATPEPGMNLIWPIAAGLIVGLADAPAPRQTQDGR